MDRTKHRIKQYQEDHQDDIRISNYSRVKAMNGPTHDGPYNGEFDSLDDGSPAVKDGLISLY